MRPLTILVLSVCLLPVLAIPFVKLEPSSKRDDAEILPSINIDRSADMLKDVPEIADMHVEDYPFLNDMNIHADDDIVGTSEIGGTDEENAMDLLDEERDEFKRSTDKFEEDYFDDEDEYDDFEEDDESVHNAIFEDEDDFNMEEEDDFVGDHEDFEEDYPEYDDEFIGESTSQSEVKISGLSIAKALKANNVPSDLSVKNGEENMDSALKEAEDKYEELTEEEYDEDFLDDVEREDEMYNMHGMSVESIKDEDNVDRSDDDEDCDGKEKGGEENSVEREFDDYEEEDDENFSVTGQSVHAVDEDIESDDEELEDEDDLDDDTTGRYDDVEEEVKDGATRNLKTGEEDIVVQGQSVRVEFGDDEDKDEIDDDIKVEGQSVRIEDKEADGEDEISEGNEEMDAVNRKEEESGGCHDDVMERKLLQGQSVRDEDMDDEDLLDDEDEDEFDDISDREDDLSTEVENLDGSEEEEAFNGELDVATISRRVIKDDGAEFQDVDEPGANAEGMTMLQDTINSFEV